jgi:polysaccharide export outer membrane protein
MTSSACVVLLCSAAPAPAQQASPPQAPQPPTNLTISPAVQTLPPGYVVGVEDVLSIVFWRERDMSADVVVRPDGKISLPLLDDIQAAGYTPEQLSVVLETAAAKFVSQPNATVVVREIHSRKVYVVGQVTRPGTFPLAGDMNVLQAIAMAGGLLDYADKGDIAIVRLENGRERRLKFNYNDVVKGKNVAQNVVLKPGDTIVVR